MWRLLVSKDLHIANNVRLNKKFLVEMVNKETKKIRRPRYEINYFCVYTLLEFFMINFLNIYIYSGLTHRHLHPKSLDRMNKRLAINVCDSRNLSALIAFLGIENGQPILWKKDSKHLLIRYLLCMDRIYKWTVLNKVSLSTQNHNELKRELNFFKKLCDMNESYCKLKKLPTKNRIHHVTRDIICGTMSSMLELTNKMERFRPYRTSNSQ